MASRISVVGTEFTEGTYIVKYDHEAQRSNQLTVQAGQKVELAQQNESKGWVWAQIKPTDGAPTTQGYVPGGYLEKASGGDYDQWAYGAEFTSTLVGFYSGLMIFLYGSALQEEKSYIPMAAGCLSMMASSFLMVIVVIRNKVKAEWRGLYCIFTSIFLFMGYPTGVWGGIVLLFTAFIELIVFVKKDLTYMPEMWDPSKCCDFWKSSLLALLTFAAYVAANVFVFALGATYGGSRVDDWTDPTNTNAKDIGKTEWEFAQACAVCICFNLVLMLIFVLQGFQNVLIAVADRVSSQKQGKMATIRDFLKESFSPESMIRVHQVFALAIIVFTGLHIIGCFAAYENSGPSRDFDNIFGDAPYITGGVMCILLAVILASSWIPVESRPSLFNNMHRLSFVLFFIMLLHGEGWWAPNFWKWMVGPMLLYLCDKTFRYGLFNFRDNQESEMYEYVEGEAIDK